MCGNWTTYHLHLLHDEYVTCVLSPFFDFVCLCTCNVRDLVQSMREKKNLGLTECTDNFGHISSACTVQIVRQYLKNLNRSDNCVAKTKKETKKKQQNGRIQKRTIENPFQKFKLNCNSNVQSNRNVHWKSTMQLERLLKFGICMQICVIFGTVWFSQTTSPT